MDRESLGDEFDHLLDLEDRLDITIKLIAIAAFASVGIAVLVGVPVIVASIVGAIGAGVALLLLWLRARRRGDTVYGELD